MILVVGGADTGRAPMAATMLRKHLTQIEVESAGVLGHDDDTWQAEARLALQHLGYIPAEHSARSVTRELLARTQLVVCIDRGVARALELQYGIDVQSLPNLAQTPREVMDPFRMTLDAWLIYGRELEQQVKAALPQIKQFLAGEIPAAHQSTEPASSVPTAQTDSLFSPPVPALQRLNTLVNGIAGLPEVVDWRKARTMIRETLQIFENSLSDQADLRAAAISMLRGVLGETDQPLNTHQLALLQEFITSLEQPLDASGLGQLGGLIGRWNR